MTLRLLDLFSGIGGFSFAAERLVGGFETVQFVERKPFCQEILRKHWPDVPIHDDIRTFRPEPGSADVICGGFPCQDISTAGKQAGIKKGTRSGLFYELIRIVCVVRPRFVILENVAAILDNAMLGTVLGELAEAGFDAEWACIPASAVGACHQRDRWWAVAYANNERTRWEGSGEAPPRWSADGTWRSDQDAAYPTDMLSVPEPGDGGGADAADTNHPRLEGRQPAGMSERGGERPTWSGDPPGGRLNPDWRSYVSEPVICRSHDGFPGRVDRLKALGNAVVPQVAAIPLARVRQLAAVWQPKQQGRRVGSEARQDQPPHG
jgi:DNA (cytosine-5)-methyltransferase 1